MLMKNLVEGLLTPLFVRQSTKNHLIEQVIHQNFIKSAVNGTLETVVC